MSAQLGHTIDQIYRPDNAVLVLVGDLNIDSTRALVHETETRLKLSQVRRATPRASIKPAIRMGRLQLVNDQNRQGGPQPRYARHFASLRGA